MGYNSDVSLSISKKVLTPAMILLTDDLPELMRDAISTGWGDFTVEEDYYNFRWNDIKWYNGYPEVDAVAKFVEGIAEEEEYHFLRLGEEQGDIEDVGYFDDEIHVRQSIESY